MGKLLIVSISDHEEHIFNRVMAAIADEPDFDHISPPLPAQPAFAIPKSSSDICPS